MQSKLCQAGGTTNSASRGCSRDVWGSQVHATSQPLLVRTNAWTQRALNLNYVYAQSQISQFDWASCQVNTKLFSDSSKPFRVLLWLVVRSSQSIWAAVEHLSIWINLRSKQNQSPSSHLSCVIEVRLLITWSRAFNCSPCEAFFLFIGWDQLCLSCSWGVHSRTITRMKEFEIQPRIVDTVFTPGFWKMTKDWKCLQDDNKFHHGRQRAYCGEAGLSPPPHSAMLLCCRCVQVQRSSKQSLLPTKANSEAEGWCAFATCSATLSNSSIFVQRRPFQRVFYSIRFSGMVS